MNAMVTTDFDTFVSTTTSAVRVEARAGTRTDRLHPAVLGVGAVAYAVMIAVFAIGFVNPEPVFGISFGIVVLCLAAFLGLPYLMGRDAAKFWRKHGRAEQPQGTFGQFLNARFETADGTVSGAGALALVVTVPACLAMGVVAMAIIRNVV
jgi:hypothetical protein